jgi:maltooligosyltrehalose trehalohydrolase
MQAMAVSGSVQRRFPIGAEVQLQPGGGVHFRIWAPASPTAAIEFSVAHGHGGGAGSDVRLPLVPEDEGYFSGFCAEARPGQRYKIRLADGLFPDPASRFQPEGPHGPSEIVDPNAFAWTDHAWSGRPPNERIGYELHLGTFTPEGTWNAARAQLDELARLGVTFLEIMPLAEFPGRFGWGYDGVDLFAPSHLYGTPDDVRRFIDRAHALRLMVLLDVVYNHFGPDGNYLAHFSRDYGSRNYACEWGEALNFDGENSGPVREFFISNARYWIEEFHFDGLRFDATQQIFDRSPSPILRDISRTVRAANPGRALYLVGENEAQHARLARPESAGGAGLDALWNDDFHHAAMVAATGRTEAYYLDYRGTAQELVSAVKRGFLYQGQWYRWQEQRRGQPTFDLAPENFVIFLQNHDQVANALHGHRLHRLAGPAHCRALTALLLLAPSTPMLFQGQEFAASAPFLFFADHHPELARDVRAGRLKFLQQFRSIASEEAKGVPPDPAQERTFTRCKLDFAERERHAEVYRLHTDLIRLRREDPVFSRPGEIDGAVLSDRAFVLRYFSASAGDRLLLVNLGPELHYHPAPEPLLAPLENQAWRTLWSSESPQYDGYGTPALETSAGWILPAASTVVLQPDRAALPSHARLSEKN